MMAQMEGIRCVSENGPVLISAIKATKTLGISPQSLWTKIQSGTITSIKIGWRVFCSSRSSQDWVTKRIFVGGDKNGKYI